MGVGPLRAIRFVRGFRILRILRGLRVLRALKTIPAFEQFAAEREVSNQQRRYHRGMNLVLLALTGVVLASIVAFRRSMEVSYIRKIDESIAKDITLAHLKDLGGSLARPDAPDVLVRKAVITGREHTVYFDLSTIDNRINQFEFFLTLGMLFSMFLFMYILAYHHMDVTQTQLRGLLNLALRSRWPSGSSSIPACTKRRAGCRRRSCSWTSSVSPRRAKSWPTTLTGCRSTWRRRWTGSSPSWRGTT